MRCAYKIYLVILFEKYFGLKKNGVKNVFSA